MARNRQKMPVIGHRAPGDQPRPGLWRLAPKQIELGAIVFIAGEHLLPPVATLGDTMGEPGDDKARKAGHWEAQ